MLAHPTTISLLHMHIIVVLIRSGPRQREVVRFGSFNEWHIDKSAAVIEVEPCHRTRQTSYKALDAGHHIAVGAVLHRNNHRPASEYVGERDGVQIFALEVMLAMRQYRLQRIRVLAPLEYLSSGL
ncbi:MULTISPECIES: hypothetical protein [Glutamicibacter]|uniref:hypothetical protein n=2 Tax=Glutamicibacter TaxID=1742989 RepID=UPI002699F978